MSKNRKLANSGISPLQLTEKFGSPLYVYDGDLIGRRCRELKPSFSGLVLYYASKANENPEIVRLIAKAGFGIETVSPEEIRVARRVGVPVSKITFTCSSIDEDELVWIVKQRVRVHLDSLTQVEMFGRNFPGRDISVRLNQGIGAGHHAHVITGGSDSKFGIDISHLSELRELAKKYGLRVIGLHQHIGSNILEIPIFIKAMEKLCDRALRFPDLKHLDFGGGFGVPYKPSEKKLNLKKLGGKVKAVLRRFEKRYGKQVEFSFEPGRYLVAEVGSLLVRVNDIKRNPTRTFIGVNSGMNHLIRPALYGSYHEVLNATHPRNRSEKVTIAGNMCESGDLLAKNRFLPSPEIGDILVVKNAGAYGYSMSSHYNLRPRPAEILVLKHSAKVIRKAI
ncbi:diaminopimelate decarboxylase [Candidatus Jorgensenbacteria bacterium GWA1_49_17]|uniref:Diaminopimelate decarboxylase n=2 Tax=Candidatus Joergenseniibacteriota TaxID=1752739 RepID=A0A1F6BPG3_9BACT|nr:MAG: diaminopimelate decarboxylase [Candidatus Jorgensenbacteria bacterium GWC1_48_12]OGG40663.1 MAG: diaminopimelate decarboxylase [Candidatus Jorgensenbacteria bacterium GWA1_49_17]